MTRTAVSRGQCSRASLTNAFKCVPAEVKEMHIPPPPRVPLLPHPQGYYRFVPFSPGQSPRPVAHRSLAERPFVNLTRAERKPASEKKRSSKRTEQNKMRQGGEAGAGWEPGLFVPLEFTGSPNTVGVNSRASGRVSTLHASLHYSSELSSRKTPRHH